MMTANELTQMLGRVVRSPRDIGHNYIIDPQFGFTMIRELMADPQVMFPLT